MCLQPYTQGFSKSLIKAIQKIIAVTLGKTFFLKLFPEEHIKILK